MADDVARRAEGDALSYFLSHETWLHRLPNRPASPIDPTEPTLYLSYRYADGDAWSARFTEYRLSDGPAVAVEMFDDSFRAFTQMPELFTALADGVSTLDEVRVVLDGLDAKDTTDRVAPKHICDQLRGLADELEAGEVRRRG